MKKKLKFELKIDIPDTLVMTATHSHDTHNKVITLSIARKYLKVFKSTFITNVSGIRTQSLLRAFIVNLAHELVHIILCVYGTEPVGYGSEFKEVGEKKTYSVFKIRFEFPKVSFVR